MVEPVDRIEYLEGELALAREQICALDALSGPYRAVFETSPDAIVVADLGGIPRIANSQAAQLLGYESAEALVSSGTGVLALVAPGHRERAQRRFGELVRHGQREHAEYDVLRADGTIVPVELSASLLRDEQGNVVGAVGIARDLTERRRAEQERRQLERQLEQAQRLESLGVLAGGVAHDFNNLLVGILGNVSLLRREIPERWNARRLIDRIETAATRAADLTRQMLAYAGHGSQSVGPVDLGVTVRQLALLLEASIPDNVAIRYQLAASLPPVRGDAGQIQQILMNLIINAAEAMGGAPGTVHVAASLSDLGPGATDESTGALVEPGRYVCLEVTDTGAGMDSSTRRRIFDPFFSTKFAGRGLGLAAVAGIVRTHGGAITLASQPGAGSTFKVYLRPADGRGAR